MASLVLIYKAHLALLAQPQLFLLLILLAVLNLALLLELAVLQDERDHRKSLPQPHVVRQYPAGRILRTGTGQIKNI